MLNMESSLLASAEQRLQHFRSQRKWYRRWSRRSAVAMVLREEHGQLQVLMIERAERAGDPWSGHMAFPGGMLDPGDRHTLAAARRETLEEVGLDTEREARLVTRLSDRVSRPHSGRRPMVITPYVFGLDRTPALRKNYEVADILWVPLAFLADSANRQRMHWRYRGMTVEMPCYFYLERRIWGLSLMMLDELLTVLRHQRLSRR